MHEEGTWFLGGLWVEECLVGRHAGELGRGHSLLAPCIRISSAVGIWNLLLLQGLCLKGSQLSPVPPGFPKPSCHGP